MEFDPGELPKRKLYFESCGNGSGSRFALVEDGKLCEFRNLTNGDVPAVGEIYCGRVADISHENASCFVLLTTSDGNTVRGFLNNDRHMTGDEIIVCVSAPASGNKFCRLSERFSIPGRYIVLTFDATGNSVKVSRRISSDISRQRLYELGDSLRDSVSDGVDDNKVPGILFRTEAESAEDASIKAEFNGSYKTFRSIIDKFSKLKKDASFGLVYAPDQVAARLLEYSAATIEEIHTDSPELYDMALRSTGCGETKVHMHKTGYFSLMGIDREYARLSGRTVYLPSGGNIVIDRTEAMTVIDVNSSGAASAASDGDLFFKTNMEAAEEIARQLRLRSVTGTIVCDFINMDSAATEAAVFDVLKLKTMNDPAQTELFGFTKLKLFEITRSKGVFA
jgi:ribonuclease G